VGWALWLKKPTCDLEEDSRTSYDQNDPERADTGLGNLMRFHLISEILRSDQDRSAIAHSYINPLTFIDSGEMNP
jgi:hypothetical protein